jgi:hypothetical protein
MSKFPHKQRLCVRHGDFAHHSFELENEFESKLNLARRISAGGFRQVCGTCVACRKVLDSNSLSQLDEVGRSTGKAIVSDHHTLVVAVERIEGLSDQFDFVARPQIETTRKSNICRGVVGTEKRVAPIPRQTIVGGVAVLVGIAENLGINRAAAADGDHPGKFPVVENLGEDCVVASEQSRLLD